MGFLKTILIILLVYYLFKVLVRMFAPKILGYAAKKTEQHFRDQFGDLADRHKTQQTPSGEVIIEKKSSPRNDSVQNVGDYIDFEEIE